MPFWGPACPSAELQAIERVERTLCGREEQKKREGEKRERVSQVGIVAYHL